MQISHEVRVASRRGSEPPRLYEPASMTLLVSSAAADQPWPAGVWLQDKSGWECQLGRKSCDQTKVIRSTEKSK
jgi:hypothetical protein